MLRGCWVRLRLRFPDGHLSSADKWEVVLYFIYFFILLLAGLACVLNILNNQS